MMSRPSGVAWILSSKTQPYTTVCICRLILFTISFVKLLILHLCCFLMFFSNAENTPLFLLLKQLIVFLFLPSYLFSSSLPPILNTVEIRIQDKSGFELWLSNVLDFEWLGGVIAIRMQASLDHLTNKPFQNRTKKLNRGGLLLVSTGLPFCGMVFVKVKWSIVRIHMILERDHIICPKVSKIAHVRSNGLQYSNAYCTLLSYQSDLNSIFFKAHNLPTLKCHRVVKVSELLYIRTNEQFSCCVFWPAFGYCAHLRAGQNIFWAVFNFFY